MQIIENSTKYINFEILNKCFIKDRHLKVDKVMTGNGFSTAFLTNSVPFNKINIMIAPNKAVVIDKEKQYQTGNLKSPNNIGFYYKEGKSEIWELYNLMVFVADSFFLYADKLFKIRHKINNILIDEAHSIEIQSIFRYSLKDFDYKISRFLNTNTAITSVTASPNHFTKIDIKIKNNFIPDLIINVTKDRMASTNRAIKDVLNGENVIIASNAIYIYKLISQVCKMKANYIVGSSLLRNMVTFFQITEDAESGVFFISSRGFEGFDIYEDNCKVYFFEDRANEFETFYISNLYQAISRARKGAKYIEYSVRFLKEERTVFFDEQEINNFISNDLISCESKQKKEYENFHPFVIFNQDKNGVFSVKRNNVSISLHKEKMLYDKGFDSFKTFLNDRKITLNYLDEVQKPMPRIRFGMKQKTANLALNTEFIKKYNLFDDFSIKVVSFEEFKQYKSYLENYFIKKVYDSINLTGEIRTLNSVETKGFELLTNYNDFSKLVSKVTKAYNKRSIDKYGKPDSKKFREEFKIKAEQIVGRIIVAFINSKISVPPQWVANRNYNLFTTIGVGEIKMVGAAMGITVTEVDIKTAFPRILYAINGKSLPLSFYGDGKINKIAINKALNNVFYRADNIRYEKKYQRRNKEAMLQMLGIDQEIIDYIFEKFFESKFRGDLFNFLSFHEKKIISDVKKMLEEEKNLGVVRRHDSVLIFGLGHFIGHLNEYEYLGQKGWFSVQNNSTFFNEIIVETYVDEWEK